MALSSDGRVLRTGRVAGRTDPDGRRRVALEWPGRRPVAADCSGHRLQHVPGRPPHPRGNRGRVDLAGVCRRGVPGEPDRHPGRAAVDCLVLAGNHFGTRVVNNHFMGGVVRIPADGLPNRDAVIWGWSHAPFLGGLIEGNILEDAEHGSIFGLEHDPRYIKSNQGRTYMTVQSRRNVFRWSDGFVSRFDEVNAKEPPVALTLGYSPSNDASELVVSAVDNRLEAPPGRRLGPSLIIHGAQYNSKRLINRKLSISSTGEAVRAGEREAIKQPALRPR